MIWWIFGGLGFFFVVTLIFLLATNSFGWSNFFSMIVVGLGYLGSWTALQLFEKRKAKPKDNKRGLDYCWMKANEALKRMDGAETMEWDEGLGRETTLQKFFSSEGKESKEFRSFLARLKSGNQLVIVLWDIEDEVIAKYVANPSADLMEEPFKDFKPFGKEERIGFDRFGRRRDERFPISRRTTFNRPIQFPGESYVDAVNDPFKTREDKTKNE
jgi:hypothetical protein